MLKVFYLSQEFLTGDIAHVVEIGTDVSDLLASCKKYFYSGKSTITTFCIQNSTQVRNYYH